MTLAFPIGFAFGAVTPNVVTTGGAVNDIDAMAAANAQFVRFGLSWDEGDPGHTGAYTQTAKTDRIIQYCNSIGFGVILSIGLGDTFGGHGTSAVGDPGMGFNRNANADGSPGNKGPVNVPKLLSQFMVAVGTRYAPKSPNGEIMAIELGNEANHEKWDQGVINGITCSGVDDNSKGAAYLEYLARVFPPLDALGVTVLTTGLGGITNDVGDQPADQFLSNLYASQITIGGKVYKGTDGLWHHFAFHPYSNPDTPTADLARTRGRGWWLMVNLIVPLLNAHGHLSKGIWITEVGCPTNGPDIATSCAWLVDAAKVWGTYSWGGGGGNPFAMFKFVDGGGELAKGKLWGVVDPSYAKKQPFWQTYHDLGTGTQPPPPSSGGIGINAAAQTAAAARVAALWSDAGNTDQRLVRIPFGWNIAQAFPSSVTDSTKPTYAKPGQYDVFDWTAHDAVIDAHEAAGNTILAILGVDTPPGLWPVGATDGHCYPNRDAINGYRDYANYVYSFVARYCGAGGRNPGVVVAAELQNEPNLGGIAKVKSDGTKTVSAADYWPMAGCAAIAVKTGALLARTTRAVYASSDVQLISAGTAPVKPGTANAADQWVAAGLAVLPYLDGVAHHLYGLQCPPDKVADWNQRTQVLPPLRTVLDTAGYAMSGPQPRGIWITEDGCFTRKDTTPTNTADTANCGTLGTGTGDASQEVTEATAATRIGQVLDGPTSWFWTNKELFGLVWITWYEEADTAADWANSGGLAYKGGAAKTEPRAAFVTALGAVPTRGAPTASISNPVDDPTFASPDKGDVIFICPSSDAVDDPTKLIVKLYRDSGATLIGACTWSALVGWFYPLDTTSLTDGHYAYVTKVTNTAGITTTSAVVHRAIDNAAQTNQKPTVAIVAVTAKGVTYTSPTLDIPAASTVTVEITVSDDHDSTILPDLYAGGVLVATGVPKSGVPGHYLASFDSDLEADAIGVALVATATDSGGLTGTSE